MRQAITRRGKFVDSILFANIGQFSLVALSRHSEFYYRGAWLIPDEYRFHLESLPDVADRWACDRASHLPVGL